MNPPNSSPGSLDGVRVIDIATVVAGPGAARHLADFGADVIKIEKPGGDETRSMGWRSSPEADSLLWSILSRGKRCVSLDLKSDEGREQFMNLIESGDILVENMRPGRLERLGLGPESLHARNPSLVVLRVSGFGQQGPYSQKPGFATIVEALSGYSDLCGVPNGQPLLPPIALTDEVTALVGAFAAVVALRYAERTGVGQVVDVNLFETMLNLLGPLPAAYDSLGYQQPRLGAGIPYTVPRGTYRCRDGVWVAISASSDSIAGRVLGILSLSDDPRFVDFQSRSLNRSALEDLTTAWIGARDSRDVVAAFEAADAAIAVVNTVADVVQDRHVLERSSLHRIDGILMQTPVARMSKTPPRVRWAGPRVNETGKIAWRTASSDEATLP